MSKPSAETYAYKHLHNTHKTEPYKSTKMHENGIQNDKTDEIRTEKKYENTIIV